MNRLVGLVAAGLGHALRFLVQAWAPLMRLVGFGLMTYAVSQFDTRVAYGFAGACLIILFMQTKETTK